MWGAYGSASVCVRACVRACVGGEGVYAELCSCLCLLTLFAQPAWIGESRW